VTYPNPSDPVSALTRADGTTVAHSNDHGRIIGMAENVMHHGAVGDGVTDDTAAFQAAIDASPRVFVPGGRHYVISDKLTVNSPWGLHLFSDQTPGTGFRLLCNNFPANTDVFEFTASGNFPQCRFEHVFVDSTSGTAPRDFVRVTFDTNLKVFWRNVWVQGMDGYAFNCPTPYQVVRPNFENCDFVQNAAGGTYVYSSTAARFAFCRWVGNASAISGGIDAEFDNCNGLTLDTPTFDGYAPGANNYDRLNIAGAGITIINPYFEWTSAAATGSLRNVVFTNSTDVLLIGGFGTVIPANGGGSFEHLPIDINGGAHIMVLEPPLQTWRGNGTYSVRIQNMSGGVTIFGQDNDSNFSVDTASAPDTTIYNGSRLLRSGERKSVTVSGATPATAGAPVVIMSNGGATTVTNMTGGQANQEVTVFFNDSVTTLQHAATGAGEFFLSGATNLTPKTGTAMRFVYISSKWRDISLKASGTAYTQTYSTADRTHAAPTAATLTVTDGAGTNDNTIGAITGDASVIAAVQELADEINKLVADVADVKQVVNAIIDDMQTVGIAT
jgi:hypothetical protein